MMKTEFFFNQILKYRTYVLILVLLSLLISAINLNKFRFDASSDTLILESDNDYKIFKDINKLFPNKEFLVIAYNKTNSQINNDDLKIIAKLQYKIENINGIESTFSILDAPIILSAGLSLNNINTENIKTITSKEIDFNSGLDELKNSPIFREQIISIDGLTTAIIAYLKKDENFDRIIEERNNLKLKISINNDQELKKKLKKLDTQYQKYKDKYDKNRHQLILDVRKNIKSLNSQNEIYLGGISMIADDSLQYVKKDILNFGIAVLFFILLILFFLFRNIKWVIFPVTITFISLISTIGLLGAIGWKVTVISSNFISLIIILTISMNVHIIVRYLLINTSNTNNYSNISKTMSEMIAPCIYTTLTTIVAFLSLIFSDIKPVVDFGWIMSMALIITLISSLIILPILISYFPNTKSYKNRNIFIINKLSSFVKNNGKMIIFINIIIIIISILGITKLKVENSFINYFKKGTEIYQGMKLIDNNLGGTTPLDIIVKFKDENLTNNDSLTIDDDLNLDNLFEEEKDNIDYWLNSEKLNTIKKIDRYLNNKKEIGKVQSIQQFIDLAEQINKGSLSSFELTVLYKKIPQNFKDDLLNAYISIEDNMVRFTTRIIDSGNIERNKLIKSIKIDLKDKFQNVERITVNGLLVLYNNMLQSLFSSQIKSLTFVLISIFIMFLLLFKSFTLSIAAIIPNIFAASFILGLIGIFNIPLDMMTITIAAITIGIAVDNSIHYIYRVKKELINYNSLKETIDRCHKTVGSAILTTSITIAFGFSILMLSNFYPTIYFGIFTGIAMIVAMMGIMTTLPIILIILKYKKSK